MGRGEEGLGVGGLGDELRMEPLDRHAARRLSSFSLFSEKRRAKLDDILKYYSEFGRRRTYLFSK